MATRGQSAFLTITKHIHDVLCVINIPLVMIDMQRLPTLAYLTIKLMIIKSWCGIKPIPHCTFAS